MKAKTWIGAPPKTCQLCGNAIAGTLFIDGKTKQGPWAIMCVKCHDRHGVGFGTGLGQQYECINGVYTKTKG